MRRWPETAGVSRRFERNGSAAPVRGDRSVARPRFVPTADQRRMVRSMAAYGIQQEEIAHCVGIRSTKTLRRHFREDLDRAGVKANAQVATSGKNALATMFWHDNLLPQLDKSNPALTHVSDALGYLLEAEFGLRQTGGPRSTYIA